MPSNPVTVGLAMRTVKVLLNLPRYALGFILAWILEGILTLQGFPKTDQDGD